MERVLWPMEPVEPRIASFFTRLIFSEWSGLVLRVWLVRVSPLGAFSCKVFIPDGLSVDLFFSEVGKVFYFNHLIWTVFAKSSFHVVYELIEKAPSCGRGFLCLVLL